MNSFGLISPASTKEVYPQGKYEGAVRAEREAVSQSATGTHTFPRDT